MTISPITNFSGLTAVVTGGGTGMGRELTSQLMAQGCSVAICDISQEHMDDTVAVATAGATSGARITTFIADVSDAAAMDSFAAHVAVAFGTDQINLVFNNAGIAGGGSLIESDRDEWDRVFNICWNGVLNGTRSFLPMLINADRGHLVNTSSINGLWACLGPTGAHTAYSSAKFAVRGLTEALTVDFKVNAPHLTASVVMPGHIGTAILRNSWNEFGRDPKNLQDDQVVEVRTMLAKRGVDVTSASDEDLRNFIALRADMFENAAPTTASEAATIILDGVKAGDWRILVGEDAHSLDELLRERPHDAYTEDFMKLLSEQGHFDSLIQS